MKERLIGATVIHADDRTNEVISILGRISDAENNGTFDHWIERWGSVGEHKGDYYHE
jgi:hypothetical protein